MPHSGKDGARNGLTDGLRHAECGVLHSVVGFLFSIIGFLSNNFVFVFKWWLNSCTLWYVYSNSAGLSYILSLASALEYL
jgi:hypothetical protein